MSKFSFLKTIVIFYMAFSVSHIPDAIAVDAAKKMVSTQEVVQDFNRAQAEKVVINQLSRTEVQTELVKYGVNVDDAKKRVASLSDVELQDLSSQIEKAQYGGSVAGILVVVVLVLLIIYLARRI